MNTAFGVKNQDISIVYEKLMIKAVSQAWPVGINFDKLLKN